MVTTVHKTEGFPTPSGLYRGSLIASVVHAVAMAKYPDFSYEHSWDGSNYCMNDGSGTRGCISFTLPLIVGVFRDDRRPDLVVVPEDPGACKLFRGAPKSITRLAHAEALQYLLDDASGVVASVITTAFWCVDGIAVAASTWPQVVENGAHSILPHCLPEPNQWDHWLDHYDIDPLLADLAARLFERLVSGGPDNLRLNPADVELVRRSSESEQAFAEVLVSLRELGFGTT